MPRPSEVDRELVLPEGIVSTSWPSLRSRIESFGVALDPWQASLVKAVFGKRADGEYACGVGGAVISTPRQVGQEVEALDDAGDERFDASAL